MGSRQNSNRSCPVTRLIEKSAAVRIGRGIGIPSIIDKTALKRRQNVFGFGRMIRVIAGVEMADAYGGVLLRGAARGSQLGEGIVKMPSKRRTRRNRSEPSARERVLVVTRERFLLEIGFCKEYGRSVEPQRRKHLVMGAVPRTRVLGDVCEIPRRYLGETQRGRSCR